MRQQYTWRDTLQAAARANWRIEDLIGGDRRMDFGRPFLPESLARTETLPGLSSSEKLALNHIRGHAYLCIFGLVEEFILPFVLDHVRPVLSSDDFKVRALLQFAGEEAKHIQLFKRFREEFERDFGSTCDIIGPPAAIAAAVLKHKPLAVALTVLHIEWMTQGHYIDSVKDAGNLDPTFKDLLRHHWMEEAQHAKLDTLIVESLATGLSQTEIESAVEQYLAIGGVIDGGLRQQVEFDLAALETAACRNLSEEHRAEFRRVQLAANRWTYLGSGMTHPNFLATLGSICPAGRKQVEKISGSFR